MNRVQRISRSYLDELVVLSDELLWLAMAKVLACILLQVERNERTSSEGVATGVFGDRVGGSVINHALPDVLIVIVVLGGDCDPEES